MVNDESINTGVNPQKTQLNNQNDQVEANPERSIYRKAIEIAQNAPLDIANHLPERNETVE